MDPVLGLLVPVVPDEPVVPLVPAPLPAVPGSVVVGLPAAGLSVLGIPDAPDGFRLLGELD